MAASLVAPAHRALPGDLLGEEPTHESWPADALDRALGGATRHSLPEPLGTGLRVRAGVGLGQCLLGGLGRGATVAASSRCDVLLADARLPPPGVAEAVAVVLVGDPSTSHPGWLEREVHRWVAPGAEPLVLGEAVVSAHAERLARTLDPGVAPALWQEASRHLTGASGVVRVERQRASWVGPEACEAALPALAPVLRAARQGPVAVAHSERLEERFGVRPPGVEAVVALPLGPRASDGVLAAWSASGGLPWTRAAVETLRRLESAGQRVSLHRRVRAAERSRQRAERLLLRALDVVSHDLRSPLFAIQLGARLLERRHGAGEEFVALQGAVQASTRLVQRLVLAGRQVLEAPAVPPAEGGADLGVAMEEAGRSVRRQAPQASWTLELEGRPVAGVAPAVATQLCAALLDNAWRHRRGPGEVRCRVSEDAEGSRLEIRNPGQLPFLSSERLEPFEVRGQGGLGLGLFEAHRLAAAAGVSLRLRQEGPEVVAELRFPAAG